MPIRDAEVLAVAEDAGVERPARREKLAERRKSLGLTQEDLASLLNVERTTVVRWERGDSGPLPWIRPKLAKALKVPVNRLAELLAVNSLVRPGRAVPRQLPAAVADFTGRAAELEALARVLDDTGTGVAGTVVISAIGGTAGVGKTALALRWAHEVASRFADGQLYVNLRGFDPSGNPVAPSEAVFGFLEALGVPPERIPSSPDARVGAYRSLLADKRILIVLDNARDEEQVRPLLPASPGSLVLVTSRNRLAGLAASNGARLLSLDVLTHDEAVQLLAGRLGRAKCAEEPEAVGEIASACACLPLALTVAASRAADRPGLPLAALADELHGAGERLAALDAGDPAASVRAVFSWSYRQLGTGAARMFRLLGVHPGPDISVPAAASLAGTDVPVARKLLRELARAHLVAEHVPGRYAFHDLLRAYAAAQAQAIDDKAEHAAAISRLLDHYLHTASRAALILRRIHEPVTLDQPSAGTTAEHLAGYRQAVAWFEAEHQVMLGAVALADSHGFAAHAWQLPWAMMPFQKWRGHYQEWACLQRTALEAATCSGDIHGQAVSSSLLALACVELGDCDQAASYSAASLKLYRQLGSRFGEGIVHHHLHMLACRQDRLADALEHGKQALYLFRAVDHKPAEAQMLNNIGTIHALLGDYRHARALLRQALALSAEAGYRALEIYIWDGLGYTEHHLGNLAEAVSCYQSALAILLEFGEFTGIYVEGEILLHLGDSRDALGEPAQAREAWERALRLFEVRQHPRAEDVRAKLADLDT